MKTLKEFFVAAVLFGISVIGCGGGSPVQDLKAVAPPQAELQSIIADEAMAGTCADENALVAQAAGYRPMIQAVEGDTGQWGNDETETSEVTFWISEVGNEADFSNDPPTGVISYEFIYAEGDNLNKVMIGILKINFVMSDGAWKTSGYQIQCKLDVLGMIQGRVVNAVTGEPMENARVYAQSECGVRSGLSIMNNINGEFVILGTVPGKFTLHAIAPGFQEAVVTGLEIEHGEILILDQTIQMIPLVDQTFVTLTGRIFFRDGETPLSGVDIFGERYATVVYLANPNGWTIGLHRSVDAEGRYQITFVSPGEYQLRFSSQELTKFVDENGTERDYLLVEVSEAEGMVKELPDLRANNLPPQIDSIALVEEGQVAPGASVRIQVGASDPDQDNLAYYWRADNGMLSLSQGSMAEWTAPDTPGTYTIEVIANDGKGGADSGSIQITVAEPS
ncbi:MAG: carboxypeptidase regulatory-like domain-containing protein [Proteobacteria bacterium]|nr:carboxypeptidase regulatory-like domain-containing protein [Pseudomonadota bacterium]